MIRYSVARCGAEVRVMFSLSGDMCVKWTSAWTPVYTLPVAYGESLYYEVSKWLLVAPARHVLWEDDRREYTQRTDVTEANLHPVIWDLILTDLYQYVLYYKAN